MDAVEHLASRFAALVLANKQAEALIGMYTASGDRGYLDQARAVLQDSTVPVRLASHPRTPRERTAAHAIGLAPNAWDDLLDEPCFASDEPTPADVLARFPMPRRT